MRAGIQTLFAAMGEGGCLVFAILAYLEDKCLFLGDWIKAIEVGIQSGCIAYNPDDPKDKSAGYVKDSIKWINLMTGKKVKEIRQQVPGNQKQAFEGYINFWQLAGAQEGVGHFTYGAWNSLEYSNTVKNGFVRQIRKYEII